MPVARPRIRSQLKATITSDRVSAPSTSTSSGTCVRARIRVRNHVNGNATTVVSSATSRHRRSENSVRPM